MQSRFENFLEQHGYKKITPSGHPSTIYDYVKAINNVCDEERMSWNSLASKINDIVPLYDEGGEKKELGLKSHKTVINALKRYQELIENMK